MAFDPFEDFETRGYLRNVYNEKDPKILKELENASFSYNVEDLASRSGVHFDWEMTNKHTYLTKLTNEILAPNQGHLDDYLKPVMQEGALSLDDRSERLKTVRGMGNDLEPNTHTFGERVRGAVRSMFD